MMAQLSQITAVADIQSSPEKFYNALKYKATQLTSILPSMFKKSELIQGEIGRPGNVKFFVYELGIHVSLFNLFYNIVKQARFYRILKLFRRVY